MNEEEPPETIRNRQGPRWWSRGAREAPAPELATEEEREAIGDPSIVVPRRARRGAGRLPNGRQRWLEEACRIVDAIREMLGMAPLYAPDPLAGSKGPGLPIRMGDGGRRIGRGDADY